MKTLFVLCLNVMWIHFIVHFSVLSVECQIAKVFNCHHSGKANVPPIISTLFFKCFVASGLGLHDFEKKKKK